MRSSLEQFYDQKIIPECKARKYLNAEHKTDCVKGMEKLFSFLKDNCVTIDEGRQMVVAEGWDQTDLEDQVFDRCWEIPLYLEEITGEESAEIVQNKQFEVIKFLCSFPYNQIN